MKNEQLKETKFEKKVLNKGSELPITKHVQIDDHLVGCLKVVSFFNNYLLGNYNKTSGDKR